jgi:hypothetical protein
MSSRVKQASFLENQIEKLVGGYAAQTSCASCMGHRKNTQTLEARTASWHIWLTKVLQPKLQVGFSVAAACSTISDDSEDDLQWRILKIQLSSKHLVREKKG